MSVKLHNKVDSMSTSRGRSSRWTCTSTASAASQAAAWAVPTDKELMIARHTRRVLG